MSALVIRSWGAAVVLVIPGVAKKICTKRRMLGPKV